MNDRLTYPPRSIGFISRPTPEERNREGDRWVSLRTLDRTPVALNTAPAPEPAAPEPAAPEPTTTRALFHAVDQRHACVRRKLGL